MTVRIRGIYATALTAHLGDVVQASGPIRERFDADLGPDPADARVDTTRDRQGLGVVGDPDAVERVTDRVRALGRDVLTWAPALAPGAIYAGEVTETLGGGAVVDVGDGEGYLPYSRTARRIEAGDRLRVQVTGPRPPWSDQRPGLDTDVRVEAGLATLVRGGVADAGAPELADLLPTAVPEGWGVSWERLADDADLDALDAVLGTLADRARGVDEALDAADPPADVAPATYWPGEAGRWLWLGRETRFALDDVRREVTPTMPGHHRIKAGAGDASAAVDFVEAVCPNLGGDGDQPEEAAFPFATVARQFGPAESDRLEIVHGKPAGHAISLGTGTVTAVDDEGTVTVEREMSPGGTYDALGTERRAGDVAVTKVREGRWWYPTVYRGSEGQRRGTYVNVCTPVEVFPEAVRYVDLHVDVVRHADGTVERVDDDELDAAVADGSVADPLAEKARSVARAVESALS